MCSGGVRPGRGGGRAATIAAAALLLACQAPLTTETRRESGGVCTDLAYIFFLVAEKRDRGSTQEAQLDALRQGTQSPFAVHPEQTLRELSHVVELVYRRPEASAREIEAAVRDHCAVDERGQAVLRAAWPRL